VCGWFAAERERTHKVSIDGGGCRVPAVVDQYSLQAPKLRMHAGSVMLTADGRGSTPTCLLIL